MSRLRLGARAALLRWHPTVNWSDGDISRMEEVLRRTGAALGVLDEGSEDPWLVDASAYQWLVIEQALDAASRQLLRLPADGWSGYGLASRRGAPASPPLKPARMMEKLNVNLATQEQLEALPGLGPASAGRLLASRLSKGSFEDLEQVRRAAGLSEAAYYRVRPLLRIGPDRRQLLPGLYDEIERSGVTALAQAISGGEIGAPFAQGSDGPGILLDLVEHLAEAVARQAFRPRFWSPDPRRLASAQASLERTAAVRRAGTHPAAVAPVSSRKYQPLLLELIGLARQRIWCQMFFFSIGGEDSPGDDILEALVDAAGRGVDVRLILDHDLPGDYHGARDVNQAAFKQLADAGIAVRAALPDITAHAKALLVDDRHVLLGSHNWTASSFYRYEDTSLYAVSEGLAADLAGVHERRWRMLAERRDERIASVVDLEMLNSGEKTRAAEMGIATHRDWIAKSRRSASRRRLAEDIGLSEARIRRIGEVLDLMAYFRISETTALALAVADLDTTAKVRNASRDDIVQALDDLSALEPPFGLRRIPPGVVDYLWKHR